MAWVSVQTRKGKLIAVLIFSLLMGLQTSFEFPSFYRSLHTHTHTQIHPCIHTCVFACAIGKSFSPQFYLPHFAAIVAGRWKSACASNNILQLQLKLVSPPPSALRFSRISHGFADNKLMHCTLINPTPGDQTQKLYIPFAFHPTNGNLCAIICGMETIKTSATTRITIN